MPRNSSTIQPGRYEATLIGVRLWKPYNIEKGADFVLKLDEGQEVAWYAKAFHGPTGDGGMSLKAIMHFLTPYDGKQNYNTASLLDRYIGVILERKVIRGREVLVITGFFFSTKELFRFGSNGNGHYIPGSDR